MRPTFLQFRSPKEKTPDPYDICLTCDGSKLGLGRNKSPTFAKSKRFEQYHDIARKTGYFVGPGSYSQNKMVKIKGPFLYRPLHFNRDPKKLIMVGDSLMVTKNDFNDIEFQRSKSQYKKSSTLEKLSPSLERFRSPKSPSSQKL
jgi:hypothetical protein